MIKTEQLTINNKQFTKTYSSSGFMVERDGALYSEAARKKLENEVT